ncbi:unnamed protein product [Clonostachys chloroleuca]|uniref:Uncharacterized protein n=1 Tax=Clonostachys chloroleuca TaxID=1926264 RepID=A0AA35VUC5_9HYPO|nr:unnamed protein product [Clonostachys chloroleuca]
MPIYFTPETVMGVQSFNDYRVERQVEGALDGGAIGNGDGNVLGADLSIKVPLGGELGCARVLQSSLVALELLHGRVKAAAKVVLDVIDDKGGGELVAAGNALDKSWCRRHLYRQLVYAERKAAKDAASSTTDKPAAGDVPPVPRPQNIQYKSMIGYVLQTEMDAAIRRDRKGLEADLIKLVGINSDIFGYGDKWKSLILEVEQFQRKWQITQPLVREGRKVVQGHKLEDWRRIRHDGALSKQMRFFAAHNELLAFSNGTVFDRDAGYGSFQCYLWSVWRVMEYMGIAEDVKL